MNKKGFKSRVMSFGDETRAFLIQTVKRCVRGPQVRKGGRRCNCRMSGWTSRSLSCALLGVCGLAQANVGRTVGTFHVDQNGAATYSVPIFAPRGPDSLEPHISLTYNSQDGVGYVGVGWSVSGLSEIYRCNKTVAQDGTASGVALQISDGYCLDSGRLRLTSGTYGTAGSVYQTELANFSQVTAEGTAGNGPAYWEVKGKDGLTYEYGNGGNSQVIPGSMVTPYEWWLDKVTDRAGNTMTITYSTANTQSEVVPKTISWTPSSHGSSTYAYTMQFNYTTNTAAASLYGYVDGVEVSNSNQLQSISVQYNGATVREYFLTDQPSKATSLELLTGLKECADLTQTNCLASTSFAYQDGQIGVSTTANSAASGAASNVVAHYDFNGDGRDDLAYCNGGSANTIEVAFSTGSGYGAAVNTGIACGAIYGDLLGDGKDGILANHGGTWYYYTWNGTSFSGVSTGLAFDSTATQYVLADIDGDGLPDLIESKVVTNDGSANGITLYVRDNTSSGSSPSFSSTNSVAYTYSNAFTKGAEIQSNTDFQFGNLKHLDFNGDGRDDLALELQAYFVTRAGPEPYVLTEELISAGSTFTAVPISEVLTNYFTYIPVSFINFNSDKCTDYVLPALSSTSSATVYIAGCNGTNPTTLSLPTGPMSSLR